MPGHPRRRMRRRSLSRSRLAHTPVFNRVLLHITPRSLVWDGLQEALSRKEIITDPMIEQYWDFLRIEGTRAATVARINTPYRDTTEGSPRSNSDAHFVGRRRSRYPGRLRTAIPLSYCRFEARHLFGVRHVPQEEVADMSARRVRMFLAQ